MTLAGSGLQYRSESLAANLRKLADELADLAETLDRGEMPASRTMQNELPFMLLKGLEAFEPALEPEDLARRLYQERRLRDASFGLPDLFAEPAWDILLDLFHAEHAGKRISVTSACLAAAVPQTTALRWVSMMERMGLIERLSDERDGRRSFVRLTPETSLAMRRYLKSLSATRRSQA